MNKKITTSAPGKLTLLGEHAVVYNHPCLVTAVNQRMKVTVEFIDKPDFYLEAPDIKLQNYKKSLSEIGKGDIPKGAQFVEIAINNFKNKFPFNNGLQVTTTSEFSSQFGFGSSSASTVSIIKALAELTNNKLSNEELFDIAYKTVLDIQGKGSGFDIAAAIFGGTLYFVTGGKVIEPLSIKELSLVIGYSGIKGDTVTLLKQVAEKAKLFPSIIEGIYSDIDKIVELAKNALIKHDWKNLGMLMNFNQGLLASLGVSTDKLASMIYAARASGAYGAKLSGAGGGDCMISLAPYDKKRSVELALEHAGGTVIRVACNAPGVRIEK